MFSAANTTVGECLHAMLTACLNKQKKRKTGGNLFFFRGGGACGQKSAQVRLSKEISCFWMRKKRDNFFQSTWGLPSESLSSKETGIQRLECLKTQWAGFPGIVGRVWGAVLGLACWQKHVCGFSRVLCGGMGEAASSSSVSTSGRTSLVDAQHLSKSCLNAQKRMKSIFGHLCLKQLSHKHLLRKKKKLFLLLDNRVETPKKKERPHRRACYW